MVPWFYNHKAGLEASRKILIFHEKLFIFKSPSELFKKFPGKYRFPTEVLSRGKPPLKTVNLNLHFLDNKLNINYIYPVVQLSRFLSLSLSLSLYFSLPVSISLYLPIYPSISPYLSLYLSISNLTNKKKTDISISISLFIYNSLSVPIWLSIYLYLYPYLYLYT